LIAPVGAPLAAMVVAGLDRAAVHHEGTKDTKDTKKKRDGGVHTHISLLFFVSFVSFV
jgi:hypothetical protein